MSYAKEAEAAQARTIKKILQETESELAVAQFTNIKRINFDGHDARGYTAEAGDARYVLATFRDEATKIMGFDGTCVKDNTVLHLTPELAEKAFKKVEEQDAQRKTDSTDS